MLSLIHIFLAAIGRMDLMVLQTADIAAPLNLHLLEKDEAEEIDDELVPVELRCV